MRRFVQWRSWAAAADPTIPSNGFGGYHDDFYSDPVIQQWYKNWAQHVMERTNKYRSTSFFSSDFTGFSSYSPIFNSMILYLN